MCITMIKQTRQSQTYIYIGILWLTGLFCQQPASRHCGHVMPPLASWNWSVDIGIIFRLALGTCNSWAWLWDVDVCFLWKTYPLVNYNITMENHIFFNIGWFGSKVIISYAVLVYVHRLRLKTYSSEDLPSIHVPAPMWMTPALCGKWKNSSGLSDGSWWADTCPNVW